MRVSFFEEVGAVSKIGSNLKFYPHKQMLSLYSRYDIDYVFPINPENQKIDR